MRVRYGGEYRRLQQERNLLLWAFVLLVILTLLLVWQYEVRIEQLERLLAPKSHLPLRGSLVSFRSRRGLFLSGAEGTPRLRKHRGMCNRPHGRGLRLSGA